MRDSLATADGWWETPRNMIGAIKPKLYILVHVEYSQV